jgi:hypothetical protein
MQEDIKEILMDLVTELDIIRPKYEKGSTRDAIFAMAVAIEQVIEKHKNDARAA